LVDFTGSRLHYPLPSAPSSRSAALRFVWVAAICFPEDSHLRSTPMLGAPTRRGGALPAPPLCGPCCLQPTG